MKYKQKSMNDEELVLYLRQGLKFDIQRDTPLRQSTEFSRKGVP
jgi:hypothetical protein